MGCWGGVRRRANHRWGERDWPGWICDQAVAPLVELGLADGAHVTGVAYFFEFSGIDVIDEAADRDGVIAGGGDPGVVEDGGDTAADIPLESLNVLLVPWGVERLDRAAEGVEGGGGGGCGSEAFEGAAGGLAEQFLGGGIPFETGVEQVICEGEHTAAGVMDEDDLVRVQQVMGDDEAADGVFSDHAPGVADNVGFTGLEAEEVLDIKAGVHAGHDGDAA